MDRVYRIKTQPLSAPKAVVKGEKYRISILTPWLFRLEYSESGNFEDRATQCVLNRQFPVPEYQIFEKENSLEIVTEGVQMIYDKQRFSKNGLSLQVKGGISDWHSIWHYGEEATDLLGTARTLDEADGAVKLEHGVISRNGYAVLDDSHSLLLREDGWVEPGKEEVIDLYFFGYGHQYEKCLKDFYTLTGNTPLLPRYTLGNWWSRYHKYSEEEYMDVVKRFEKEEVPFSVSVIDMDWHLVDIAPKYGSGWTGYTWNKELFPDPKRFMDWLHRQHLKVTLNVHPADGVRPYEEQYRDMAEELGIDWEKEEFINFDIADPGFLEAYFKHLHHPHEENGVDFWWVDWQQGGLTKVPGLDPLWMLNHYHYLDSKRQGKRGLTFSRYAGPGSHRYPVGFSGDTIITWASLDFQPYFTANASNIGYGWWSHDIGGHMRGRKDDELSARWVQFGVFSPIMRLHSSNSRFTGKEPWNYNKIAEEVMKRYLRLRHELIPYLYTMNCLASFHGQPLIRPMYYLEPEQQEAYEVPNEYYFGTELIACPVTKQMDRSAGAAPVEVWLPEGKWFDIFNGRVYDGGKKMLLYRGISDIPVLAKAGGIVPMTDLETYTNSTANPEEMTVMVFPGADGEFHLLEDEEEGHTDAQESPYFAETVFTWEFTGENAGSSRFLIQPPKKHAENIPGERRFTLKFYAMKEELPEVLADGKKINAEVSYCGDRHVITVRLPKMAAQSEIEVCFHKKLTVRKNDIKGQLFKLLQQAEIEYDQKERIMAYAEAGKKAAELLALLQTMKLSQPVYEMLCEVLLAE